jgi:ribosomal protein S18 acetylase RimI-like enzyme
VGPDDWETFRDVRLAALKEAPYAFGSKWENEKDRSEEEWRHFVASRWRFVAVRGGQVVGTAAGGDANYTGAAALTSLWVEPGSRGLGIGDQLVIAVLDWAKAAGFSRALLWVSEGNLYAEALYRRHGFSRTGEVVRDPRREFEMSRPL